MLQSDLFLKIQKDFPKEEKAVNARFLLRAGFIDKLMAGVHTLLPLGFMISEKIKKIVRDELNKIGAQEIFMPVLQPKGLWDTTNRYQEMERILYHFEDHQGKEIILGPTHEEVVTSIAANMIHSYKDLPKAVYQIQTKFRDEKRVKSGLLRGKEFTMKDLYSFHKDEPDLDKYYEEMKKVYLKIFKRCGLSVIITKASGGYFSKYSHEFMVESDCGEDTIFFCPLCGLAINKEIVRSGEKKLCPQCQEGILKKIKTIEVGNIFKLGKRFSLPFKLFFKNQQGQSAPVLMGCYGLGIERTLAAVVENKNDKDGIIWPEQIAPFRFHIVILGDNQQVFNFGEKVYRVLLKQGAEVLFDNRDISSGQKLVEADLLGMPYRLIISEKTLVNKKIEVKKRTEKKAKLLTLKQVAASGILR